MKLNMCLWSVSTNAAMNILHAGTDFSLEGSMFVRSSRFCSWNDDHQDLLVSLSYCSEDRTSPENRQSANPLSTSRHSISLETFRWMDSSTGMIHHEHSIHPRHALVILTHLCLASPNGDSRFYLKLRINSGTNGLIMLMQQDLEGHELLH